MKVVAHFNYWSGDSPVAADEARIMVISKWTIDGVELREGTVTLMNDGPFLTVRLEAEIEDFADDPAAALRRRDEELRMIRILADRTGEGVWLEATDPARGVLVLAVTQLVMEERALAPMEA